MAALSAAVFVIILGGGAGSRVMVAVSRLGRLDRLNGQRMPDETGRTECGQKPDSCRRSWYSCAFWWNPV